MLIYNKLTKQVTHEKVRKPLENEVVWIRLLSPETEETKHVLGHFFECHPLLIEDCIKLNQRPKMDHYKNNIFIAFFSINQKNIPLEVALVVGSNYVISIYKEQIPILDNLYEEFKNIEGKMENPGEILYHIMDRCVDEYVSIIDHIEDKVEELEIAIHQNPYAKLAKEVFDLKRITHDLRRIFVEERTILGTMSHQSFPYSTKEEDVYFVDILDHITRVIDSIDIFRESIRGLMEMQMSLKSDRMNEIMKVLTIFSTIFLPLSFIVGLYGMNLKGIPEYSMSYGYLYVWILMIVCIILMVIYFKKKKWL